MIDAYKKFWTSYADFSGRSTRSDFWWVVLAHYLVLIIGMAVFALLIGVTGGFQDASSQPGFAITMIGLLLFSIYSLAAIVPSLAIQVRRLRDAGYHWAFIFLGFIPYLGGIILFIFNLMPSKQPVDFNTLNQQ